MDVENFLNQGVDEEGTQVNDVKLLLEAWRNEKLCPEIQHHHSDLIERISLAVKEQEDSIQEGVTENLNNYYFGRIFHSEVERVKYMIRDYLRLRLWKIEKYALHILKNERRRLSEPEYNYAVDYVRLFDRHFKDSFLSAIPDTLRKLYEQNGNVDMVPRPDTQNFVFVEVKEKVGEFQINEEGDIVELDANDRFLLKYEPMRVLLAEEKIALI
eukprot:Colp12_sorted_trinity150504_noHs@25695